MTRKKKLSIVIPCGIGLILVLVAGIFLIWLYGQGEMGRCLIADGGAVLWIDENGSPVVMHDRSKKGTLLEGLQTGDRIWILHDGIEESYPGSTGVYACIKVGSGTRADLPQDTIESLRELGWLDEGEQ